VCCMVCHGELYRLRPASSQLTAFYLCIAAGGALGGLFVSVVSPLIFTDFYELHWGLLICAALFFLVCVRHPAFDFEAVDGARTKPLLWDDWRWAGCGLPVIGLAGLDWFIHRTSLHHHAFSKGQLLGLRIAIWSIPVLLAAFGLWRG